MPFSPIHVSNNVLKRSFKEKKPLNAMKLQKILYFIGCEYNKILVNSDTYHEPFLTWQYGPALSSVHYKFTNKGANITSYGKDAAGNAYMVDEKAEPQFAEIIDLIWEKTKDIPTVTLARITCQDFSAWAIAYTHGEKQLHPESLRADYTYQNLLGISHRTSPTGGVYL